MRVFACELRFFSCVCVSRDRQHHHHRRRQTSSLTATPATREVTEQPKQQHAGPSSIVVMAVSKPTPTPAAAAAAAAAADADPLYDSGVRQGSGVSPCDADT